MNNATKPQVPVTILTGFLGAGKTSLLNHILSGGHGKRIAVLVNDFGSVNIDASLIDNKDGEVVSLENGCICCSLSEGLLMSVVRLIQSENPPEHIVVETSGVSDPIEVARTFSEPDLQPYAPLEGIVTVVDSELAPSLEDEMAALARHQVLAADITVLNKVDLVDEDGLHQARSWVTEQNPRVRTVEVSHGKLPLELLFDIGGTTELSQLKNTEDTHDHHDEPPFDTYTYENSEALSAHALNGLLSQLPKSIFRVKGLVNLLEKPNHPCILQATGKRATLTIGQPWGDQEPSTRIVFIGSRGGVDGDWLERQLVGHPR